jgi:hypothetical protein
LFIAPNPAEKDLIDAVRAGRVNVMTSLLDKVVQILMNAGANVNAKNNAGLDTLTIAETLKVKPEIIRMLKGAKMAQ